MRKIHNFANSITVLRMAGTLCLLFLYPLSSGFCAVYTLTGLTDVLDGWVARKTKTACDLGAKLDSIADLLFYTVMLIRCLPVLQRIFPAQIWYAVAGILLLRLSVYLVAAVKYRRFAALHTYLNKLTGGAVFLLPYLLATRWVVFYCWTVCMLAAIASLEELVIHLQRRTYQPDTKSIFQKGC